MVVRQPEIAFASASSWSALRLLHSRHRSSIGSEWPLQRWDDPPRLSSRHLPREIPLRWVPPPPRPLVCDPDQVALPRSIAALYTPGPSADGRAVNPSVSDIHP